MASSWADLEFGVIAEYCCLCGRLHFAQSFALFPKTRCFTRDIGETDVCCLTSRWSQPKLSRSVPLSRFTPQTSGCSAFFVSPHCTRYETITRICSDNCN